MPRTATLIPEAVERAQWMVSEARSVYEMRLAQATLLPAILGVTIEQTAQAIGQSTATVSRLRGALPRNPGGINTQRRNWGGRRRAYLTVEEEQAFLAPFFEEAQRGGILVVSVIQSAFEEKVGRRVPKSTVYDLLARHGWRKLVPDKRHPKSKPELQEEWKKNSRRK